MTSEQDKGLSLGKAALNDTIPAYLDAHLRRPGLSVVEGVGMGTRTSLKASLIRAERGEFVADGDPQFLSLVQHLGGARVWQKGNRRPVERGDIGMEPFEGATWSYDGRADNAAIYVPFAL